MLGHASCHALLKLKTAPDTNRIDLGKIDNITVEIILEGDLTDEQREILMSAAKHCPVHKTLTTETRVTLTPATQ